MRPTRARRAPWGRAAAVLAGVTVAATSLAACGGSGSDALVLYSAQHQDLADSWAEGFTAETGIEVDIRGGGDFELANQILAEGDASPADVFITENSPALSLLSGEGALSPLEQTTLEQVPADSRSQQGDWVGIAARSTTLVYDPAQVAPDQLPASILGLAQPQWQGRVAVAPGGADFQAIVSAVFETSGDAVGSQWLDGLADNAERYQNNIAIMKAVDSGEIAAGVIYSYYWYADQAEGGQDSDSSELHYFGNQDPGAFVSYSAGGVVASTERQQDAQRLLAYISGPQGQEVLSGTDAMQYSVGDGVASNPALPTLAELDPPVVDLNALNGPKIIDEMQRVGLI